MCRSIMRLREGASINDRSDIEAAALQFVRKVSGFREPAVHNRAAFDLAVARITDETERLMAGLEIRGGGR